MWINTTFSEGKDFVAPLRQVLISQMLSKEKLLLDKSDISQNVLFFIPYLFQDVKESTPIFPQGHFPDPTDPEEFTRGNR